jgi:hypothetical protein
MNTYLGSVEHHGAHHVGVDASADIGEGVNTVIQVIEGD